MSANEVIRNKRIELGMTMKELLFYSAHSPHEKKPLRRGAKKGACLKKEVCSLQKYHRLE